MRLYANNKNSCFLATVQNKYVRPAKKKSIKLKMSRFGALATTRNMEQTKKLKSEHTSKLEVESQRMEARLKILKTMLAAEKTRRNVEGAIHWKSNTTSQSPKKLVQGISGEGGQSPSKPVRVRVLTDKKRKNKVSTLSSAQCGQCDKSYASLCCVECVENYCQVCFVKIHQKGALANHHVKPFLSKVSVKSEDRLKSNDELCTAMHMKQTVNSTVDTQETSDSLLNGAYDEESSAASFQEALAEWRAGDSKKSTTARGESVSQTKDTPKQLSSTSTNTSSGCAISSKRKEVEIAFSRDTGVSYLEKLITRRNRYDPTLLKKMAPKQVTPVPLALDTEEDSDDTMDYTPTKYNIFYEADSTTDVTFDEDCKELYQPLASVQIEEITEPADITTNTPELKEPPQVIETKLKKREASSGKSCTQTCKGKKKVTKKSKPNSAIRKKQLMTPSLITESEVQLSVQKAWADSSKNNQYSPQTAELSQFFLQGVEAPVATDTPNNELDTDSDAQLQFAATIWLPYNSVTADQPNVVEDSDSDSDEPSRCNSALSYTSQHDLESTELLAERNKWDQEELNNLAWELTSTIESEGRLSRCNSELDNIEDNYEAEEEPVESDDVQVETVDMNRVVSQFELYQQQLLEEEM